MTTKSREAQNSQPVNENLLDLNFFQHNESIFFVREVLDDIITQGAEILHLKYLRSQIKPYASRTLAQELIMNTSWAFEPLGFADITIESDEDIDLPAIDEWAGGVIPVRDADANALRLAVTPVREVRRTITTTQSKLKLDTDSVATPSGTSTRSGAVSSSSVSKAKNKQETQVRQVRKPQISVADELRKTFEEQKKKTAQSLKSCTVDADFSIIQIVEPHNLPPSLIVPKVTTKKALKSEPSTTQIRAVRPPAPTKQAAPRRKPLPKLVEPDTPIFDEEMHEINYGDKFVCAPGVTFKDGNVVKSRPQQSNPNQMTKAQYEHYLEEMKKNS